MEIDKHSIGDSLLKMTVNRVNTCLRGEGVFSRLGGDEFAVIKQAIKQPCWLIHMI